MRRCSDFAIPSSDHFRFSTRNFLLEVKNTIPTGIMLKKKHEMFATEMVIESAMKRDLNFKPTKMNNRT
jgi:hypothetical protein